MERKASKNEKDFSVPDNYFANLNKRLENRIGISEAIPKATGFTIPDGYLDEFENRLWDKIKQKKSSDRTAKVRLLYAMSSIAAMLILGFILMKPKNSFPTDQGEELSTFDINSYIEEGFINLNTYDLIETFEGVSLEDIEMTDPIPREEIIEYLNQNNIDNYTLTVE
ncbi:hypothetical protein [Galbibacter sp.]|jgi:hypothetical protein|uniref:hypothetical protein n=1 Tax=Galbibacter sp. TaxID=2918471 RepID=UPI003A93AA2F